MLGWFPGCENNPNISDYLPRRRRYRVGASRLANHACAYGLSL
jgi:hypothetical protein